MLESLLERKSNVEHRTGSIITKHVIDSREEPARWVLQSHKSVDWSRFRGRVRTENVSTQILPKVDGHRTNVVEELELRIGIDNQWGGEFLFAPCHHAYETSISNVAVVLALVYNLRTGIKYQVVGNVVVRQSINQMILVRNSRFFPATMTGIETGYPKSFGDLVGCIEMQCNSRVLVIHKSRGKGDILRKELNIPWEGDLSKHALGHHDQTRDEKNEVLHG